MTLIQCNNDGGDMQRLSNTEHNPTEDRGEVHIRGERAGYALKLFALPVLDLDITTYLGAFNGCRQDTRNSADEAQECFIGIRIKTSATSSSAPRTRSPTTRGAISVAYRLGLPLSASPLWAGEPSRPFG